MIQLIEKFNFEKLVKECISDEQKLDLFDIHKAAFPVTWQMEIYF